MYWSLGRSFGPLDRYPDYITNCMILQCMSRASADYVIPTFCAQKCLLTLATSLRALWANNK